MSQENETWRAIYGAFGGELDGEGRGRNGCVYQLHLLVNSNLPSTPERVAATWSVSTQPRLAAGIYYIFLYRVLSRQETKLNEKWRLHALLLLLLVVQKRGKTDSPEWSSGGGGGGVYHKAINMPG